MPSMVTGAQVVIDSVDQTANLTGVVEIDIDEGMARTATFTLRPGLGITDLLNWVSKPVQITSIIDSVPVVEFNGIIDEPNLDIVTGLATFACTDNLQETFETKTKAEIDALIPNAWWDEGVFNDSEGWQYATERMSSIPSALDMDAENTVRITDWAAKTTPDFTFNEDGFLYQTLRIDAVANRMNIVNAMDLAIKYRYTRLWERETDYNWDDGLSDADFVCGQADNPYPVPNKTRIEDAIEQSGWELTQPIVYKEIPVGGPYPPCDVVSTGNPLVCRGATFTLGKRYHQIVTENYSVRVESQDSIVANGEISLIQTSESVTDYDLTAWNDSKIVDGWDGFGTPALADNGDMYANQDNTTDRGNGVDTAINVAKTRILSTHRNTMVSFEVPYSQSLDVIHTVQVNSPTLTAKGKASQVVKRIDTLTGRATCVVTLRISKKFGLGTPGTEKPPAPPPGLPTVPDDQTADLELLYHLGGQHVPPDYDTNWSGWIANYDVITEPTNQYPKEFVIHTSKITLNSKDNVEASDISLINVTIPDDLLQ